MQSAFARQCTPDQTLRAMAHTISLVARPSPQSTSSVEGWQNYLSQAELTSLRNAEAGLMIARIRYHRNSSDDLLARCEHARRFNYSLCKRLKVSAADRMLDEQRRMALSPSLCWKVLKKIRSKPFSVPIPPEALLSHFLEVFYNPNVDLSAPTPDSTPLRMLQLTSPNLSTFLSQLLN